MLHRRRLGAAPPLGLFGDLNNGRFDWFGGRRFRFSDRLHLLARPFGFSSGRGLGHFGGLTAFCCWHCDNGLGTRLARRGTAARFLCWRFSLRSPISISCDHFVTGRRMFNDAYGFCLCPISAASAAGNANAQASSVTRGP